MVPCCPMRLGRPSGFHLWVWPTPLLGRERGPAGLLLTNPQHWYPVREALPDFRFQLGICHAALCPDMRWRLPQAFCPPNVAVKVIGWLGR